MREWWFSRIQTRVTLSTTGAEYVAFADSSKEAMLIRYVWSFIFPRFGLHCVRAFEDNEWAVQLAQTPICTSNSKCIDVRHYFFRELVSYLIWFTLSR